MLGIVVSRADEASVHIGERLRALAEWTSSEDASVPDAHGGGRVDRTVGAELREFDGLHIELEGADEPFDEIDLLVFASRHSGDTGPLLTAHHTGNVGPAEFGGASNELAAAAPGALVAALTAFETHAPEGYDVGLEATHHGPSDLEVPSLFVEIGSGPAEWRDPSAATAAARTILSLREVDPRPERTVVGFGGGHYAPRFTRIVQETDWAVGHILPDWGLDALDGTNPSLVEQAFERSGAQLGVVDGDRPELTAVATELGYQIVGESWLRETTGVPRTLVDRLETRFGPIDNGLRIGEVARDVEPSQPFDVIAPSAELLADVNGIDADRVREAIDGEAIAYETEEAGTRVVGPIVVQDNEAWRRIESTLVDLLRERFDEVTVESDAIVATEQAFDPSKARALGVEPGPAFGQLADGEPVIVDDESIPPEAVHETRTRRYPR